MHCRCLRVWVSSMHTHPISHLFSFFPHTTFLPSLPGLLPVMRRIVAPTALGKRVRTMMPRAHFRPPETTAAPSLAGRAWVCVPLEVEDRGGRGGEAEGAGAGTMGGGGGWGGGVVEASFGGRPRGRLSGAAAASAPAAAGSLGLFLLPFGRPLGIVFWACLLGAIGVCGWGGWVGGWVVI